MRKQIMIIGAIFILLQSLVWSQENVPARPPVVSVTGRPWFWKTYEDTTPFSSENYNLFLNSLSPMDVLATIKELNPEGESHPLIAYPIEGGTLYYMADYYYYTVDEQGRLVSMFVEGEGNAEYPETSRVNDSDDTLCFFEGPLKGTCASADET